MPTKFSGQPTVAPIEPADSAPVDRLVAARHSSLDYPGTVDLAFVMTAERQGDAIALLSEEGNLTYAELNQASNHLARVLQRHNVGPESIVGLLAERSTRMIVAIFGILKAGGVYLPLDPTYPQAHLREMIEDARPEIVLAQGGLAHLVADAPATILDLDADLAGIERDAPHLPPCGLNPMNLAYIMYTSGSTGKRKAVQITHQNLLSHYREFTLESGLSDSDRCMLFSSFAFDGSVEEIFCPLLVGASLLIVPDRVIEFDALAEHVEKFKLTFLDFTAGYWNAWLEHLTRTGQALPAGIKKVIIGGETIRGAQLALWEKLAAQPNVGLLITYGPTEATVIATAMPYGPASQYWGENRREGLIGTALAETSIQILDDQLQPAPDGELGEIFISGNGLARGYRGAPAITSEKFVPDPRPGHTGARMYRTGDLGRRLKDGTILFAERADGQIKIRGYRVEIGEIENALATTPGVQAALVLARRAQSRDDAELVAFVMAVAGQTTSAEALREQLAGSLPVYMIPGRIKVVPFLPVAGSGKIDRARLLAELDAEEAATAVSADDADELTTDIARIFADVLKLPAITVHDNFFKLGGHSLLVLRILSRVKQTHSVSVAMRDFFLAPSPAEFAERVRERISARDQGPAAIPRAARHSIPAQG